MDNERRRVRTKCEEGEIAFENFNEEMARYAERLAFLLRNKKIVAFGFVAIDGNGMTDQAVRVAPENAYGFVGALEVMKRDVMTVIPGLLAD